jgi:hypothetical protein
MRTVAFAKNGGVVTGSAVNGPMLLVKKLGGLFFVAMGLFGLLSTSYYYPSGWLTFVSILSLVIGAALLAMKVIRRNAR